MILVIGPTGAGKTLLLKRLVEQSKKPRSAKSGGSRSHASLGSDRIENGVENEEQREKVPPTMPTIGTNISNVVLGRRNELTLKEIGGSMAPLWEGACKEADKIIFVIDLSNPHQVSSTTTLLRKSLKATESRRTPVLLVLNKIDGFSTVSHTEMKHLLGLDCLIANSAQTVTTTETSAKYCSGVADIINWICDDA